MKIYEKLNNRVMMAEDYTNTGVVLRHMGRYQEALERHNKAMKIHVNKITLKEEL